MNYHIPRHSFDTPLQKSLSTICTLVVFVTIPARPRSQSGVPPPPLRSSRWPCRTSLPRTQFSPRTHRASTGWNLRAVLTNLTAALALCLSGTALRRSHDGGPIARRARLHMRPCSEPEVSKSIRWLAGRPATTSTPLPGRNLSHDVHPARIRCRNGGTSSTSVSLKPGALSRADKRLMVIWTRLTTCIRTSMSRSLLWLLLPHLCHPPHRLSVTRGLPCYNRCDARSQDTRTIMKLAKKRLSKFLDGTVYNNRLLMKSRMKIGMRESTLECRKGICINGRVCRNSYPLLTTTAWVRLTGIITVEQLPSAEDHLEKIQKCKRVQQDFLSIIRRQCLSKIWNNYTLIMGSDSIQIPKTFKDLQ